MVRFPPQQSVLRCRLGVACGLAAALLLLACGGGKSSSPALTGTASGGAPLAAGHVHVVDARGERRSATVAADGSFRVDASGLAGPFLLEVTGMIGGRPSVLHSVALGGELGRSVDVTPLTELLTAWVLQGNPQDAFNAPKPELSSITEARVKEGEQLVAAKARGLLETFGAAGVDVRTGALGAAGAGMDGALHALKLTPVQGGDGRMVYELAVLTGGGAQLRAAAGGGSPATTIIDPAAMDVASLGTLDQGGIGAIQDVLPEVNAQLQALAARFASGLPAQPDLAPFFVGEDAFTHNGLHLSAYLAKVLLTQPYVGMRITEVAVEQVIDAEDVLVSYSVLFAAPAFPRAERTRMKRVGGRWLIAGNGDMAAVGVNYLARVFSRPLTEAELAARSDVTACSWNASDYCLTVLGYAHGQAWIGHPGQESFGLLAYAGATYDAPGTPEVNERFMERRFSRFIGTANGRVRPYLVFNVSSLEVDPRVDHVVVTGPGLPAAGLTLVHPRPTVPRDTFIIKDDYMDWNSFNSERCQNFGQDGSSAPANCALDWSQAVAGATYHYSFRDAGDAEIGTADPRLLGRPRPAEEWFADKDRFFPQLRLPAEASFTLANVLDTSEGSPFADGGTITVNWSLPTDPSVDMESLLVWRNYYLHDSGVDADIQKERHLYSLVGSTATTQTTTYDKVGLLTAWAWATVVARDLQGNELDHEVSPVNPAGAPCDAVSGPPACQQQAFRLPPRVKAPRAYPRLVNYFHRMDRAEAQLANREDYLAQWDVLILNPQAVKDQGLDLARIRAVNPAVKILAWIPFGQSSLDFEMSTSMPNLSDYFLTTAGGTVIRWAWGGYLMNPYKDDYAFTKHVIEYIEANDLVPGGYDGLMFDCLFGGAPTFLSPDSPQTVDVDGDSGYDPQADGDAYRAGVEYLLSHLRADRPAAILTGNNAFPWWQGSSYYAWADGDMRENAFGDEPGLGGALIPDDGSSPYGFSGPNGTPGEWEEYGYGMDWITRPAPYYFVQADTEYARTACTGGGECALDSASLAGLTRDDQRRFRFALGTTLLRDGYFGFDRGDGLHGQLFWFPEYDADLGNPAPGYERGSAQGTFRQDVYGAGTYSREFANGTVVVNPTAAPLEVAFPAARTDVSTGQAGTAFHLPAWDARMYMRN